MTVLVLRALGIGDFFTGLPALAMLRRVLPDRRIVLAVPDAFRELALLSGSVDATCRAHELEPITDPPRQPELAVDLHGNGPESRQLLLTTAPRRLVAYGVDGMQWDAGEHEVARWCRLVRDGLPADGVAEPGAAGALPVPPWIEAAQGRTIVHCGAKSASRRWPPERFAEVAAALRTGGHDVVVTAGPGETRLARTVADGAGIPVEMPDSVAELAGLVAGARLVISGDTGIAHVATNYRRPSVILFGPVPPSVWGPPRAAYHQVLWHRDLAVDGRGDPHGDQIDPALARITVEEVLDACERAVAADPAGERVAS